MNKELDPLVVAIVDDLFTNGIGEKADRLAMKKSTLPPVTNAVANRWGLHSENYEKDLGGWGRHVVEDIIARRVRTTAELRVMLETEQQRVVALEKDVAEEAKRADAYRRERDVYIHENVELDTRCGELEREASRVSGLRESLGREASRLRALESLVKALQDHMSEGDAMDADPPVRALLEWKLRGER